MARRSMVSTGELADVLGVGVRTVRRMLADGRLKGVKIGSRWFVSRAYLREMGVEV